MFKMALVAAAATMMFAATPSLAQEWPLKAGNYWNVSSITVKDGGELKYATHLANVWVAQQEIAKSKGYIKSYHILSNEFPRANEPSYYLVSVFDNFVSNEDAEKRGAEMRAAMNKSIAQMTAESGSRAEYRTVGSQMLLQELMKR